MAKGSMFIGKENVKTFGPDNPHWVPEPSRWDRELFYETETFLVEVNSMELNLDLNDLDFVEGRSGVWALWGKVNESSESICLDVHETLDIGYEIRMHEKDLNFARQTPWDDPIYTENNLFSLQKRSKAIVQWLDLRYVLVAIDISGKINREIIEAQYAWNTKSYYWNRNYFQAVTPEALENQRKNEYIMGLR